MTSWINDWIMTVMTWIIVVVDVVFALSCHMANFNHGQIMRFTSNIVKSNAVILQIHVPCPFSTQYNVDRSKELCLDSFNCVRRVGVAG